MDDDDFVRRVVVGQLKTLGATEVLAAANWPAARALLDQHRDCDLVISDLDMPGAGGSTFLDDLALARPGIALIIASALDRVVLEAAEKQARKLPLRVLGIIKKPTSVDALRAMLGPLNGG